MVPPQRRPLPPSRRREVTDQPPAPSILVSALPDRRLGVTENRLPTVHGRLASGSGAVHRQVKPSNSLKSLDIGRKKVDSVVICRQKSSFSGARLLFYPYSWLEQIKNIETSDTVVKQEKYALLPPPAPGNDDRPLIGCRHPAPASASAERTRSSSASRCPATTPPLFCGSESIANRGATIRR